MVVRPAAGGMKGHVELLTRGLVSREVDVEIAAPQGSDVLVGLAAEGVTAWPVPLVGELSVVSDPSAVWRLRRLIAKGGFDLVHAHGAKAGLVARMACRNSRTPLVVTAHNHVLRRADFSSARKRAYRGAERATAPLVARWIAISESVRSELVEDYGLPPERVAVVRNGIDLATFFEDRDAGAARARLGLEPGVPVAGTAARFAPQKGLETLIDSLPTVLATLPEARVVLVGEGPLEGDLRVRAVSRGVADALVWPGRTADMPGLLAALDVYVSPSDLEGFGLVLAEAQAAGKAIVATRAGGAVEAVADGESAVVVEPGDPLALGRALAALLSDPVRRSELGAAGRARAASQFDPERMVAETLTVYDAAIADPKGTRDL